MIEEIGIQGFKAYNESVLPLGALTLLAGLNSSGKSTVLQAIAALRQSAEAQVLDHHLDLNGAYVRLGTGRDVLHEGSEPIINLHLKDGNGVMVERSYSVPFESDALPVVAPVAAISATAAHLLSGPGFQYLQADRLVPAVVNTKSNLIAVQRRGLGAAGEYTGHFLSAHRDEHIVLDTIRISSIDGRRVTPGLLAQVSAWMHHISPGVRIDVDDLAGTDFIQLRYGFGSSGGLSGTESYRATHVGFGLTYTLPIVVACLGSRPGDTILLENPEAHVHPRGQMAMGELLARTAAGGVQVLMETHSDHVLNGVRLTVRRRQLEADRTCCLYFQRPESNGAVEVIRPRMDARGKLDQWPPGFFDQFEIALSELL